MTTRGVADIVFCLDASGSMAPCLEAVKAHVVDFVRGLGSGGQLGWDLRFEFAAHSASGGEVRLVTARSDDAVGALYGQGSGNFFVDLQAFRDGLARVESWADEATLPAIDCCLDLPWRPSATCHRVLIVLTDERVETGDNPSAQVAKLPELIAKVQALGVMLFIVAPESAAFDELATAQRSEYRVVSGDAGLSSVDFSEVLEQMGRSVSASRLQAPRESGVQRALYAQDRWPIAGRGEGVPLRWWGA